VLRCCGIAVRGMRILLFPVDKTFRGPALRRVRNGLIAVHLPEHTGQEGKQGDVRRAERPRTNADSLTLRPQTGKPRQNQMAEAAKRFATALLRPMRRATGGTRARSRCTRAARRRSPGARGHPGDAQGLVRRDGAGAHTRPCHPNTKANGIEHRPSSSPTPTGTAHQQPTQYSPSQAHA